MKDNAEIWGRIYHKLQEIDQNRKFRKTIDPRQVTLEQAIARAKRKQHEQSIREISKKN